MSESTIIKKGVFLDSIKVKGCDICGYNGCLAALHFHHTRDDKSFDLSRRKCSWERLRIEVEKCIVVCANCHTEIHNGLIDGIDSVQRVRIRDVNQLRLGI